MAKKKEKPAPWTANLIETASKMTYSLKDLYTLVSPNDKACQDFQEVEKTLLNL